MKELCWIKGAEKEMSREVHLKRSDLKVIDQARTDKMDGQGWPLNSAQL